MDEETYQPRRKVFVLLADPDDFPGAVEEWLRMIQGWLDAGYSRIKWDYDHYDDCPDVRFSLERPATPAEIEREEASLRLAAEAQRQGREARDRRTYEDLKLRFGGDRG